MVTVSHPAAVVKVQAQRHEQIAVDGDESGLLGMRVMRVMNHWLSTRTVRAQEGQDHEYAGYSYSHFFEAVRPSAHPWTRLRLELALEFLKASAEAEADEV